MGEKKGELLMEHDDIFNLKSVKNFVKGLIVIVSLFIVFALGFAALVLHFVDELVNAFKDNFFKLICALAILPLIVFIGFLLFWRAYNKRRNKNSRALNNNMMSVCLLTEKNTDTNSENAMETFQKQIIEISEQLSKINLGENWNICKNKMLCFDKGKIILFTKPKQVGNSCNADNS
jgi:uncharacterized protein YqhQ